MLHQNYEDKEVVKRSINKLSCEIKLSSVGSNPKLVQADWKITSNGKTGTAYGGFQSSKDFDFQTAAALAVENAVAQIGA